MRPSVRTTALFSTALVLCLAASILLLGPLDRLRAAGPAEETLYIPSPSVVRKLSFGYTGLVADIYWTRAVQYFGSHHHEGGVRYDLLYPLLNITTALDPHLLVAYQFGSIFLSQHPPEGAGQPDKAIELVEHGIQANPAEWTLYYNLGFIYYDMGDFRHASETFARGAGVPGANPALSALAKMTAENAGASDTARLLWSKLYETSDNRAIRNNALQHLIALSIEQEIPQLEQLLRTFHERTGRYPTNFEEMVAAGWLRSVPVDPTGEPYRITPDGHVELQAPKPYVRKAPPEHQEASNSEQQNNESRAAGAEKNDSSSAPIPDGAPRHRRQRRK